MVAAALVVGGAPLFRFAGVNRSSSLRAASDVGGAVREEGLCGHPLGAAASALVRGGEAAGGAGSWGDATGDTVEGATLVEGRVGCGGFFLTGAAVAVAVGREGC